MKLLRPLYGLADSGDYFHATFSKHLTDDLRMKAVASDMSLFSRRARGKISGLLASYVDDTLACGDSSFAELTKKTREKFEMKERQNKDMRFSGIYVDKCDNGFEIHQRAYIERLESIPWDAEYVHLRRARAKPSWLAHSRPDICAELSKLAQVTAESFGRSHVKTRNCTAKCLHSSKNLTLRMRKLDLDALHIRAYSDASFATNSGHNSQLEYIIMLCDKDENAFILRYASYKS